MPVIGSPVTVRGEAPRFLRYATFTAVIVTVAGEPPLESGREARFNVSDAAASVLEALHAT